MKITEATGENPTEPKYFNKIFERGIDPDVNNPENVHAHSEVPDTWPDLNEILEYQQKVRDRVMNLYEDGQAYDNKWLGRALWLGFEHEIMHMETLLYMLIQSDRTLPPGGVMKPDFEHLAAQAKRDAVENQWFDVPEQTVQIGMDDPDNGDGPVRHFGWDVEKPSSTVQVKAFKAKGRPITNGEYAKYLVDNASNTIPASWIQLDQTNVANGVNGHYMNGDTAFYDFLHDKAVRTVYGPVSLKYALDWPVSASYDELVGCAAYMGGRIPSMHEARSIYHYVDELKKKEAANALGRTIPAVNGHLVNEGVEETPPPTRSLNGVPSTAADLDPTELFVDLEEANIGFKRWHPMPVTQNGGRLSGLGEMGGLWEWTSTVLERANGFEPMKLYPAFTCESLQPVGCVISANHLAPADFFDGKHNVVLGGSWATHPRLAGRKTL